MIIPQLPGSTITKELENRITLNNSLNAQDINFYSDSFEKIVFGNIPAYLEDQNTPDLSKVNPYMLIIFTIYLLGVSFLFYKFLSNVFQINKIIKQGKKAEYTGYTIVYHQYDLSNFSFFKYIFLSKDHLHKKGDNTVLKHEKLHVKYKHSLDIIFTELCKIAFWFNPVVWFYKKSLVKVHECQVDEFIVKNDAQKIHKYEHLLLSQYLSNTNIELAHPFNYSLIKFRIKMMKKPKSKWWAKYKVIFALPVIIISLLAFSNANVKLSSKGAKSNKREWFEPQPKGMVFIPMGSFTLKRSNGTDTKEFQVSVDAFWMKETEVRVGEYLDYLEAVKKDSTSEFYQSALPDKSKVPFEGYFTNKDYWDYPIVGVSLKQAKDYCLWLTKKENQKLKNEGKSFVANYRIPTEVEWTYASFGGEKPGEMKEVTRKDLYEITRRNTNKKNFNKWGLLGMHDNVSEWTYSYFDTDKYMTELQYNPVAYNNIIVKGNNYKKKLNDEKIVLDGNAAYNYVGFRYVRSYLGKQNGKN